MEHAAAVWTGDKVCELMVQAMVLLPGTPVLATRCGLERVIGDRLPIGPEKVLAWPRQYLPEEIDRAMLLTWAGYMARGGMASLRAQCDERGWKWRTFMRRKKGACRAIATGLQRDGIAVFNLRS